jgi:DNA helicase-2/ATP-dependent DNA helicase PcrA
MFKARPSQQEIINFEKGRMGVSAVPGSGKTHTLSYLAANLIAKGLVGDDQEVLIVTLVNSSVDNFSQRISKFISNFGLMPNFGYRVRTLHGLAHDIVKERPGLVGLENRFEIADERETVEIIEKITGNWLKTNPDFVDAFKNKTIENHSSGKVKMGWERLLADIAGSFIRQAKDLELTPQDIRTILDKKQKSSPLLELGYHAYSEYQHALIYRGAVDFEDLIRLAIKALLADPDFLQRLSHRWPYILEDEAQDSSLLQEKILRLLADKGSSWVRVGDPNQAIYETFTTASPRYLREFMHQKGVEAHDLPNSGRSTESIISLANHLITWTKTTHPVTEIQEALTIPLILPTPAGDPQPNPSDDPKGIHLYLQKLEPADEIELVAKYIKKWIKDYTV